MFEITTEASFSAAHHLVDYDGPCEQVHGHNWLVKVTVRCAQLNSIGIGIDFKELKVMLKNVLDELDHQDLNVPFDEEHLNPSSENIAHYIYKQMKIQLGGTGCEIARVEVFETPGNSASYFE